MTTTPDLVGNQIEEGDWVRIPDHVYPYAFDATMLYGTICRSALVTRVWDDGVVGVRMPTMADLRRPGSATFHYDMSITGSECLRMMTDDEHRNGGVSAPDTPYVMGVEVEATPQPRDAAGRFTSHTTTTRPNIFTTSYSSVGYASVR